MLSLLLLLSAPVSADVVVPGQPYRGPARPPPAPRPTQPLVVTPGPGLEGVTFEVLCPDGTRSRGAGDERVIIPGLPPDLPCTLVAKGVGQFPMVRGGQELTCRAEGEALLCADADAEPVVSLPPAPLEVRLHPNTVVRNLEVTCRSGFRARATSTGTTMVVAEVPRGDDCTLFFVGLAAKYNPVEGGQVLACRVEGTTGICAPLVEPTPR